jgi:hypothetical protein
MAKIMNKSLAQEPTPEGAQTPGIDGTVASHRSRSAVSAQDLEGLQASVSLGRELAQQLDAAGLHPVVTFGLTNSGKSSLLASLFTFLRLVPELRIGFSLGTPLLGNSPDYDRFARESAQRFFYTSVQVFIAGTAHEATRIPAPYFIPVVIRPPDLPEICFAFMESNGEWYDVEDRNDSASFFPQLRGEIEGVLRHYPRPMSLIYLAPYTQREIRPGSLQQVDSTDDLRYADLALVGACESYNQIRRPTGVNDNHLLLVSKWDAHASQQDRTIADVLANTRLDDVKRFLFRHYTQTLSHLSTLDGSIVDHYCSGIMDGRNVRRLSREDHLWSLVSSYPRRLWNWLYGNATYQRLGRRLRLINNPRPSLHQLLLDFFT